MPTKVANRNTVSCYNQVSDPFIKYLNANGETIDESNKGYSSEQIDYAISIFATCTNCTIDISGTNAHRTAASNDDLNTLLANGNTITLNDTLGAEELTNSDFANWTGDNPDNWTIIGTEDGGSYITEDSEKVNIVSDNSVIGIRQTALVATNIYLSEIEITTETSGSIKFGDNGSGAPVKQVNAVGVHKFYFTAESIDFAVSRFTACNIIFDNASVKQVTFD